MQKWYEEGGFEKAVKHSLHPNAGKKRDREREERERGVKSRAAWDLKTGEGFF